MLHISIQGLVLEHHRSRTQSRQQQTGRYSSRKTTLLDIHTKRHRPSSLTLCRHCQQAYDSVHYLFNCSARSKHRLILKGHLRPEGYKLRRPSPTSIDFLNINILTRHLHGRPKLRISAAALK